MLVGTPFHQEHVKDDCHVSSVGVAAKQPVHKFLAFVRLVPVDESPSDLCGRNDQTGDRETGRSRDSDPSEPAGGRKTTEDSKSTKNLSDRNDPIRACLGDERDGRVGD